MPKVLSRLKKDLIELGRFEELGDGPPPESSGDSDTSSENGACGPEGLENMHFGGALSYADTAKVHLARAFIMNPEVMVLHKPLAHFDRRTSEQVFGLLLEHRTNKGLEIPDDTPQKQARRRP